MAGMVLRPQSRRHASLALAIAVLFWTDAVVCIVPTSAGQRMQCHARPPQLHRGISAAVHNPPREGCCPGHAASAPGLLSRATVSVVPTYRPDCCAVSGGGARPLAFLVASSRSVAPELKSEGSASAKLVLSSSASALSPAESPPFAKAVFDKKADLRI
ncbi:MAG TPA: hypothetical protein VL240_09325 [Candidatus Binatia bacterium]|nr:hypothetical protein [Candidatus Binatia bacterium]